jgi:outer membrane biosynthesis protein TonB
MLTPEALQDLIQTCKWVVNAENVAADRMDDRLKMLSQICRYFLEGFSQYATVDADGCVVLPPPLQAAVSKLPALEGPSLPPGFVFEGSFPLDSFPEARPSAAPTAVVPLPSPKAVQRATSGSSSSEGKPPRARETKCMCSACVAARKAAARGEPVPPPVENTDDLDSDSAEVRIFEAAACGDTEGVTTVIVELAEDCGVDEMRAAIDTQHDDDGDTPLIVAARKNHLAIVEALLTAGANVFIENDFGRTALHAAAAAGNVEMSILLVSHGADQFHRDTTDCTPICRAVVNGQKAAAVALGVLGGGSSYVNLQSANFESPLSRACTLKSWEMACMLVWCFKANMNALNRMQQAQLRLQLKLLQRKQPDVIESCAVLVKEMRKIIEMWKGYRCDTYLPGGETIKNAVRALGPCGVPGAAAAVTKAGGLLPLLSIAQTISTTVTAGTEKENAPTGSPTASSPSSATISAELAARSKKYMNPAPSAATLRADVLVAAQKAADATRPPSEALMLDVMWQYIISETFTKESYQAYRQRKAGDSSVNVSSDIMPSDELPPDMLEPGVELPGIAARSHGIDAAPQPVVDKASTPPRQSVVEPNTALSSMEDLDALAAEIMGPDEPEKKKSKKKKKKVETTEVLPTVEAAPPPLAPSPVVTPPPTPVTVVKVVPTPPKAAEPSRAVTTNAIAPSVIVKPAPAARNNKPIAAPLASAPTATNTVASAPAASTTPVVPVAHYCSGACSCCFIIGCPSQGAADQRIQTGYHDRWRRDGCGQVTGVSRDARQSSQRRASCHRSKERSNAGE